MSVSSCSLTCNIKDKDGKVKVSALWEDLMKFFKGDRREAILHYFLTKDSNFLNENSDVLEFNTDGEVTISSLKKAMDRNGEYSDLSSAKTLLYLNNELKSGEYDYSEALDNVLKFNRSNQFRDGYMATLEKQDNGRYRVSVVRRTADAEYKLADHVQNKILTDAIRLILKDKGLSVDFLNDPNYAVQYSTNSDRYGVDGLYAIAQVLNGTNTAKETAEVAGHFIVASMKGNPLVDRLINMVTPEVQKALFTDSKATDRRSSFIVSDSSAQEAAGILVGKYLIAPLQEANLPTFLKIGRAFGAVPKGIWNILKKIGRLVKSIFTDTPEDINKLVKQAENQASTVAEGFISNPDLADTNKALSNHVTYTGGSTAKHLSEETQRSVKAFNDVVGNMKNTIAHLRAAIDKSCPVNRNVLNAIKAVTENVQNYYAPQLNLETFAKNASLEGTIQALVGITHILDTEIRDALDAIQPSDRTSSYVNLGRNARNMKTINTFVKNAAQLYLTLSSNTDLFDSSAIKQFEDANGNLVSTSLKEAIELLGKVLVGSDETYKDAAGNEISMHGLQEVVENKRKQIFVDAMRDFYGDDYINMNCGIVFKKSRLKFWKGKYISVNKTVAVRDLVDCLESDISWYDRYFNSASDCSDFVTSVGAKVTKNANMQADRLAGKFWNRIESLRIQMKDAFGSDDCRFLFETVPSEKEGKVLTGNLISEVNYGAWEIEKEKFRKQLKEDFNNYLFELTQKAYRENKNVPNYSFALTDFQKSILYHNFIAPKWTEWHKEHSELDATITNGKRYIPNHVKYHNEEWDKLFDTGNPALTPTEKAEKAKRLVWYKNLMELKGDMDALLPKNATTLYRAPQMTGRFSHRFRNIKQMNGNALNAFGHAIRRKFTDGWNVKEDEAYMFGSDNEYNEITDDPLENPLYYEREQPGRIPLFGINKLKDMMNLSTDLFGTLMQYGSMASTYNAISRVADIFELGKDVLKKRQIGGDLESVKSEQSNAYGRYLKFVDKEIYGHTIRMPFGLNRFDRKGVIRKLFNGLSSLGGKILLGGNVVGGVVNTGTGFFEILKEGMTGENFSMRELADANRLYFSFTSRDDYWGGYMGTLRNMAEDPQRPVDKNSLWIRHWNILSTNREFLHNQKFDTKRMSVLDNRLGDWFNHVLMLPYSSGDHYMQTIPYYAMGLHTKVYDRAGNQMSLMDAYDIVDGDNVYASDDPIHEKNVIGQTSKKLKLKPEIFKSVDDIVKYDTTQDILTKINNFFDSHPNLKDVTPIAEDMLTEKERKFLEESKLEIPKTVGKLASLRTALHLKANELTFNEDNESAFMDKCRDICNKLHGIYNAEDKSALQQSFYGNLVMAMRGYALGMVNKRFRGNHFSVPQQKAVEGYYNTALKVAARCFFDFGNAENWRNLMYMVATAIPGFIFLKGANTHMKADLLKSGFSEHQYYNIRRFGADFLVLEGLFLLNSLSSVGAHYGLANQDEEEDDSIAKGLLYYFTMRWLREQKAFNPLTVFGGFKEIGSLLDYEPAGIAGVRAALDVAQLFVRTKIDNLGGNPDLTNSDLYYQSSKEDKYEQGEAKWYVKWKRLTPFIRNWYTLIHPYDAAAGYEYGRRVRGN